MFEKWQYEAPELLATLSALSALDEAFPDIDKGMLPLDDVEL